MAKFGIALGSGPRGHGFKSRHSDHTAHIFGILTKNMSRFNIFITLFTNCHPLLKIITAGSTGGLLHPYKGLLPA